MLCRHIQLAVLVVVAGSWVAGITNGAGLLVADGGFGGVLEIKEHDVKVVINNGVAVTEVEQVFLNTENRTVEALYTFPVPKGASVANFSMWINGKEMIGEVVEKERARQVYESYKQKRRDPGLLEQVDFKTFEMRVFPIGPGAEQRIKVTYYRQLDFDHDWGTYVYPLATVTRRDITQRTTGRFALTLDVKSEVPIVKIESPSHPDDFVTVEHSPNYVQGTGQSTRSAKAIYMFTVIPPVLRRDAAAEAGFTCESGESRLGRGPRERKELYNTTVIDSVPSLRQGD